MTALRITDANLDRACELLNKLTGSPDKMFKEGETTKMNPGHFYVEHTGGRCALRRIVSNSGAESTICSPTTKRDLYDTIYAFRAGYMLAQQDMKAKLRELIYAD